MTPTYEITGQHYTQERNPDGTYAQVVEVSFTANTVPPTHGKVTVDQSLLKDKVAYAEAVKGAIETAVAAHGAVAELGKSGV